jgi:hypothetical protein
MPDKARAAAKMAGQKDQFADSLIVRVGIMGLLMPRRKFLWLLFTISALAAIVLGVDAIYLYTHPVVVVEWSTASELNTVGFNLYRSEDPNGKFQIINSQLIPSSPDALVGGNYSFRDTSVQARHTYYYMLEDMDASGVSNRNGPIQVRAEIGGIPEMAVAGLMGMIAGTTLGVLLRDYRRRMQNVVKAI